jgi:hypothetical protein
VPLITLPAEYVPPPPSEVIAPKPLSVSYLDPDGNTWSFDDDGTGVFATAVAGIGSPPVALTSLPLPAGGALAQALTPQTRTITIGLYLYDDWDQDAFLALRDRLTRALWTIRAGQPAPGILTISRPDGSSRSIGVLCTDGPSMVSDDATKSGLTWTSMVATFQAPDPYFADAAETMLTYGSGTALGVPPMPPTALNSATLLGPTTVTNDADADAYPVWQITGPGTPTLTNSTTGLAWGLGVALGPTETLTVDTRPTLQSAVDGVGANRWGDLTASSPRSLWPLVPGDNALNLQMSGSAGTTSITMTYVRRWLRA